MVKAPCAHDWVLMATNGSGNFYYCDGCATYKFDPFVKVPEGDLYYLEETREDEG